jgi:uncharacterized protein
MRSWVFDTHVVVAAHLSPYGPPGRLLGEVCAQRLRLAYDVRMAAEYQAVLRQPKFGVPAESVTAFLLLLEDQDLVYGHPLRVALPNADNAMFLEVAAAAPDHVLVTGNTRHFPKGTRGAVKVLTPAEAWTLHCSEVGRPA